MRSQVGLGLENTEYEPEQFPGLIYRPSEADSVVALFASGRVVITGSPDLDTAEQTFAALQDEVTDLFAVEYRTDRETSTRRGSLAMGRGIIGPMLESERRASLDETTY